MRHPRGSVTRFKNPTTKASECGTFIDEIWLPEPETFAEKAPSEEEGWLETAFVAQLVEWGTKNRRIRIAYYTRRAGEGPKGWIFAQYAPSMSIEQCRTLVQGMHDRGWFKGLPK